MRCPHCNGAIIHDLGDSLNGPRDYCMSCGREPRNGEEPMSYHLDPKKEEEVKGLLGTHSVREISARTGVAMNTVLRVRNENLTADERERLKKQGMSRARIRTELAKKGGQGMIRTDEGKECSRKECKRSGQVLPFAEFNKNRATPDGYEYHCRVCKAEEAEARRKRTKKRGAGNGRRKKQPQTSVPVRPVEEKGPVVEGLYMDPAAIRSIKRSVGKEIISEFEKFLDTRYA